MPYFNRFHQLYNTLMSISLTRHPDYDVVVVYENDDEIMTLRDLLPNIHLLKIDRREDVATMQDVACNAGFLFALQNFNPNAVIVQHCECAHRGDIIKYVADNITEHDYLTFSCFSLSEKNYKNPELDINAVIRHNNKSVVQNFDDGWYNHPIYRAVFYEFCAAITTSNLKRMNGYDERFAFGYGYNDNYFLHRVKLMRLSPNIVTDCMVIHQWHPKPENDGRDVAKLIGVNRDLYSQLSKTNEIKAVHTFTADL